MDLGVGEDRACLLVNEVELFVGCFVRVQFSVVKAYGDYDVFDVWLW